MLRDVFYYGKKPNVHPREKFAKDLADAREQCSTEHFWIINEYCDYRGFDWDFDFEFLPDEDVWAEEHNNVWPSQHQKDSGTWLCSKVDGGLTVYRSDVDPIKRKNIKTDNWVLLDAVDESKFDFSWHPDPSDPPYIYKWGCKFFPAQFKHVLEYRVEEATDSKYMRETVELLPNDCWIEHQPVDRDHFDFSWRPDPMDPPFIYVWGNKYIDGSLKPTLEYQCEGATEKKYMPELLSVLPEWDKWDILIPIDKNTFDFRWRPDPREPNMTYVFGNNQYDSTVMPTIVYRMKDSIGEKHMPSDAKLLPRPEKFEHLENSSGIDYSWIPDPTAPPYIYAWGNQWNKPEDKISIQYVVEGATEYKYMDKRAARKPCMDNWLIPENVDTTGFDFSWEPSPADPAYIYEFGTQHQKTGGPQYIVEGATEKKYIDFQKVKALPSKDNWVVPDNIDVTNFDFSWHPDSTDPAYIYQFGTQWALSGGPKYVMPDATEIKYMDNMTAVALPDKTNWEIPAYVDGDNFDYSWHPYAEDEPYVYQFGTQHQKTGGPRYLTPGIHKNSATKYIDTRILKGTRLPSKKNFATLNNYKIKEFDYSWHPDTTEEPFIYVFGSQWYPPEVMPVIEYAVPGAKQVKYVSNVIATLGYDMTNWQVPKNVDTSDFDFSWKPNPKDPPFIYQFGTQWQKTGGPRYVVPDATEIKYMDNIKAKALPTTEHWEVPEKIDISGFDFSWHPDDTDPAYIYKFSTQWAITGGPIYRVPGATEIKYVDNPSAIALPDRSNWVVPRDIDSESFDFSWHPYAEDEPYIYEFGTQWQKTGGPKYVTPGTTGMSATKYIDTRILKSKRLPSMNNWVVPKNVNIKEFDYSWHPDSTDTLFVYQFGTQWHDRGGPKYVPPSAKIGVTPTKFISTDVTKATLGFNMKNWVIPDDIDTSNFDFSWVPHPEDPSLIYEFPTQHQKTGGPKYYGLGAVEGKTPIKYIDVPGAKKKTSDKYWSNPNNSDVSTFDFSWHPDSTDPLVIYQFGTLLDDQDGPRYEPPGNNGEIVKKLRVEVKEEVIEEIIDKPTNEVDPIEQYVITTTLEDLVKKHPNEIFWALNPDIDYTSFDFNWRPSIEQARYVHAFGSIDNINTQTYFVSGPMWHQGHRDINYVEQKVEFKYLIDLFFVDRGNKESNIRYEKLKMQFGDRIQKTRYLNSWVDTINRCINRASSNLCWILNSELDYTNFDFNYYPNPWQMKMVHVFGTQWSHWGTTFMVNRESFANDTKYIKIIEHLSNLNFVKDQNKRAKATSCLYDVFVIDHGNKEMLKTFRTIQSKVGDKSVTSIEYEYSYLNTFKNILKNLTEKKEHYVWVCSSVCDYSNFDFTYICDPFAREQLHVFPSDKQKFGDTFLVNVNKLRELVDTMAVMQDYDKINFNQHQRPSRYPAPEVMSDSDTHTDSLDIRFDYPYVVLVSEDNKDIEKIDYEPMNLWAPESKNIIVTSTGGTRIVVPKEIKDVVKRELYDYPNIIKTTRLAKSKPLDIVFLSNGEPQADENYEHLLNVTKGLPNRIVRVDGVNGRVNAYHAAAEASETPWMFTVFAKLKVSNKFDWNWQPDRLQVPKHYVFHARNIVNGLVYGHQAMIAYNKKMTLANKGRGLDFTQDDVHEVLDINSGVAIFNTDEWTTWRTAFRECIKLCTYSDDISHERLKIWTTDAYGDFSQYCLDGANDAVSYFDEVAGDFDMLKLSYDWAWLRARFDSRYKK